MQRTKKKHKHQKRPKNLPNRRPRLLHGTPTAYRVYSIYWAGVSGNVYIYASHRTCPGSSHVVIKRYLSTTLYHVGIPLLEPAVYWHHSCFRIIHRRRRWVLVPYWCRCQIHQLWYPWQPSYHMEIQSWNNGIISLHGMGPVYGST